MKIKKKIKAISKSLKYDFKRLTNKEQFKFSIKLLTGFLGFVLTNVSLVDLSTLSQIQRFAFLPLCVIFFIFFMAQIHHRYRYYSSLADELRTSDKPSYLFCSYLAQKGVNRDSPIKNHFHVGKVTIEYYISYQDKNNPKKCAIYILYRFENAEATKDTSTIYFTALSSLNNKRAGAPDNYEPVCTVYMSPQCKNSDNESYQMFSKKRISPHLHLWSTNSVGDVISKGRKVSWSIKVPYKDPYDITKSHRFLIDPSNYCTRGIDKLDIRVIVSRPEGISELPPKRKHLPVIYHRINGLNGSENPVFLKETTTTQTNSTPDNVRNNVKTYSISFPNKIVKIEDESLFVLEIFPLGASPSKN